MAARKQPAKAATPAAAKAAKPAVAKVKPAAKPAAAEPQKVAAVKASKPLEKIGDGYRSPDGRFTVEGTPGAWYVADGANPSPLGTPTIVGPFRTLAQVKDAIREASGSG
jgi:hypothetical protein